MGTLGLALIMKDEISDLRRIIEAYGQYFDALYVTVTNEQAYEKVVASFADSKKIKVSFFPWCDHFGKARRFNQQQIKTLYWMWIDVDDDIVGIEHLHDTVRSMDRHTIDATLLRYDYLQDAQGNSESMQWRERLIRTAAPLKWEDVACHETVNGHNVRCQFIEMVSIRHHKSRAQLELSFWRNKALLEKDWQTRPTARTALYLASCYMVERRFDEALRLYLYATEEGDNADTKQRAWGYAADNYYLRRQYADALHATEQAIRIEAERPDAWYQRITILMAMGQYDRAAQAADVALSKKPDAYRISAQDPAKYTYKGQFLAAKAYLYNAEEEKAYELFEIVRSTAPWYLDQQNSHTFDWSAVFEQVHADPQSLEDLLPLPVKRWSSRSIVYYVHTGVQVGNWGPDTIGQGMSGSEEAVVYLSRALAKLGWQVTIFCDRTDTYVDRVAEGASSVVYRPSHELNHNDSFNIFVVGRRFTDAYGIRAKHLLLDLHDTVPAEQLVAVKGIVNTFLVKSDWHRSLYPEVAEKQVAVIGNGILPRHIDGSRPKRPYSAGYFSSYDRGLETLLHMWPKIRERVPDATLSIYYGWNLFDALHAHNANMQAFKHRILRQLDSLKKLGVTEYGRVSHAELARAMEEISVWLYPTDFTETFCITALKTAEAGMQQVCTNVGALPETALHATFIDSQHISTDKKAQAEFIMAATIALLDPLPSAPPQTRYWEDIAVQWDALLTGHA